MAGLDGVPGGIRTLDPLLRRQPLCPTELQGHCIARRFYGKENGKTSRRAPECLDVVANSQTGTPEKLNSKRFAFADVNGLTESFVFSLEGY